MAFNQDQYYPQRPGGPFLRNQDFTGAPWVPLNNFDTPKTVEDKVRNVTMFQGLNDQQVQGYVQDAINFAQTNRIGLKADKTNQTVNRGAEAYDGH